MLCRVLNKRMKRWVAKTRLCAWAGVVAAFGLAALRTGAAEVPASAQGRPAALGASPITQLPVEVMFAYAGRPAGDSDQPASAARGFLAMADGARQLGLWPRKGREFADVVSALPLLGEYPHAVALLDLTIRQLRPGSYRLNDMQAVLLLRCGGQVEPVERRIRQFLLSYTNDQVSRVTEVEFFPTGGVEGADTSMPYQRLTDSRLPEWAVWEWGRVDDLYIIGFGAGAWERAARAAVGADPALGTDRWFARAYSDCRGAEANVVVLLDPTRIRRRLEWVAQDTLERVLGALEMGDYQRSLWTVGRVDRAITFYTARLAEGRYRFTAISDPASFRPEHLAVVPAQAEHLAVLRFNLGRWLPRVVRAYVESRSEQRRSGMRAWWEGYQGELNIDVQADVLDQLGGTTVLHTYPPHPLGLPFLCTFLFEIKGEAARLEQTLGKLLGPTPSPATQSPATQPATQPAATRPAPKPSWLEARRTSDGIWYWQAGMFVVVGVGVYDDWLVVSFSPQAVRENLAFLRARGSVGPASDPAAPTLPNSPAEPTR